MAPLLAATPRPRLHLVAGGIDDLPPLRAELDAWLEPQAGADARETLLLVASELLTNACVHGTLPASLDVEVADGVATLTVTDRSPALPRTPDAMPEGAAEGGRGLLICEALTGSLAVRPAGSGKSVVATVAL